MRKTLVIMTMLLVLLTGCVDKNNSTGGDKERPIETETIVSPKVDDTEKPSASPTVKPGKPVEKDDTQNPKETAEPTESLRPMEPENTEKPEPTKHPKPSHSIKPEPSIEPTESPEESLIELMKKAVVTVEQLAYTENNTDNSVGLNIKLLKLLGSTIIGISESQVEVIVCNSDILTKEESNLLSDRLIKEYIGIDVESIDNRYTIDRKIWDEALEKLRIKQAETVETGKIVIVQSVNNETMLFSSTFEKLAMTDRLLRHNIVKWMNCEKVGDTVYYSDEDGNIACKKYDIQSYMEYKYSWNGLNNVTKENTHIGGISALRVNNSNSPIKISMAKNIQGIDQKYTYQLFISMYTTLFSGAYELCSNGIDDITCCMNNDTYANLVNSLREFTDTNSKKIEGSEFILVQDTGNVNTVYKVIVANVLLDRLCNLNESKINIAIYNKNILTSIYKIDTSKSNEITEEILGYVDSMTGDQKLLQSKLYELEKIHKTKRGDIVSLYTVMDIGRLEKMIDIISKSAVYSVNGETTLGIEIEGKDLRSKVEDLNSIYVIADTLTAGYDRQMKIGLDNTLKVSLSDANYEKLRSDTVKKIDKTLETQELQLHGSAEQSSIQSNIYNIDLREGVVLDENIKAGIYKISVGKFMKNLMNSCNTNALGIVAVYDFEGKEVLNIQIK